MAFGLLVGLLLGYFFKPQIDRLFVRVFRSIRANASRNQYEDRHNRL